ncbi:MAG: hypothetical protein FJY85_08035 [Deltaproteobacteria bacterium]|nr:hypothetical protein [Deltaproteobacteria bacterium]
MTKKLNDLRADYHRYATGEGAGVAGISFQELVEKLDKIVKLKEEMRNVDCKIPPSPKKWNEKGKSNTERSIQSSKGLPKY